ncbi:N-acetyltransferase [Mycetocola tolaasinivorans]|uniref:N-acetyltransferase n=1 Tax=Mycetocola tolaasinivorans TaxID=76635 RepID=A0A3L7A4D5_9MICO|nr:GNAT family N-acetyltransferase [Mycetocola tolaasinivorans]RLP74964.1 N-acetyltransferase [Mycetocola tolaasinivorans]
MSPVFPVDAPTLAVRGGFVLRPWQPDDVDAVFEICQDPEIQRWTPAPTPYTRADAQRVVDRGLTSWAAGVGGFFALADAQTDELAAWFGFVALQEEPASAELGYWLAAPFRGRGLATRALNALVDYSFDVVGLDSVYLRIDAANAASAGVAIRAGFELTASSVTDDRTPEPLDTYTRYSAA